MELDRHFPYPLPQHSSAAKNSMPISTKSCARTSILRLRRIVRRRMNARAGPHRRSTRVWRHYADSRELSRAARPTVARTGRA